MPTVPGRDCIMSNVVHGADVMSSLGLAETMDRAPGRHGIGNAFFIYYRDPGADSLGPFRPAPITAVGLSGTAQMVQ